MKSDPKDAQERLLELLTGLTVRMEGMEASQVRKEEKERKGRESSVFGSIIGQSRAMTREALDLTPPPKTSLGLSPGTYLGARQRVYGQAAANIEMAQAPQPELPQHYVQPPIYHPSPQQHHGTVPGAQFARVPDARKRKLGINPFDGK